MRWKICMAGLPLSSQEKFTTRNSNVRSVGECVRQLKISESHMKTHCGRTNPSATAGAKALTTSMNSVRTTAAGAICSFRAIAVCTDIEKFTLQKSVMFVTSVENVLRRRINSKSTRHTTRSVCRTSVRNVTEDSTRGAVWQFTSTSTTRCLYAKSATERLGPRPTWKRIGGLTVILKKHACVDNVTSTMKE